MTDTKAPALTWGEAFRGLLPSLNTCLVAVVTACLSIGGTIMTQRYTAKPAPAPEVKTVTVERIIERPAPVDLSDLDARISAAVTEALAKNAGPGRKRGLK